MTVTVGYRLHKLPAYALLQNLAHFLIDAPEPSLAPLRLRGKMLVLWKFIVTSDAA